MDETILAGLFANGQPHFEQLLAASYDDLTLITDYVRGKTLRDISPTKRNRILSKHRQEFIELVTRAAILGIAGDLHFGNIIYHPTDGFTIIDYSESDCSISETIRDTLTESSDKEIMSWIKNGAKTIALP